MAQKNFKPNHLELRYRTYFAVLVVPKDVRHIVGKSKFFETTGTGDVNDSIIKNGKLFTVYHLLTNTVKGFIAKTKVNLICTRK